MRHLLLRRVNSSGWLGSFAALRLFASGVSISILRSRRAPARARTAQPRTRLRPQASVVPTFSWQVPRSHRLLQLFECRHVRSQGLAIGQLSRAVAAFGIEKIQQAGRAALVGILADVARVLRLLQISGSIKLHTSSLLRTAS
jgi:hypothetical protein